MSEQIVATYSIASRLPLEEAAAAIAGEQTTGTFVRLASETDDLRSRHGAVVLGVEDLDVELPALPGARGDGDLRAGRIRLGFPAENSGASLTRLLPIVAGNLFELSELAAIKLEALDLPPTLTDAYPVAPHGVAGTREAVGRPDGVILGTIVKPNIGLTPQDYPPLVGDLGRAGLDFLKDDEVNADCPPAPLLERAAGIIPELRRVEEETGRQPLYAFNVSDDVDTMFENAERIAELGGRCVMVNTALVGLGAVAALRRRTGLVVHGHLAGLAAASRHPSLGIGFGAFATLARLAGVDHLHVGGFRSKFFVEDAETAANVAAVQAPMPGGRSCLPVISSAQWAGTAPVAWEHTRSTDLLVLAGGGILGHPDGPAAGARSIRQAWEATTAGTSLQDAAGEHAELRRALEHFGGLGR